MEDWSKERASQGAPAVSIGIGIHRGEVFAGVLGRDHLLEFTVIGDAVNVAERLERLTRQFDADIVVSTDLTNASNVELSSPPWMLSKGVRLLGREQPLDVRYLPRTSSKREANAEKVTQLPRDGHQTVATETRDNTANPPEPAKEDEVGQTR